MDCDEVRGRLSALIDGEDAAPGAPAVAGHLAACAGCRHWRRTAERIDRMVRIAPVAAAGADTDVAADRLGTVGARAAGRRARAGRGAAVLRAALVLTALAQIAIGATGLIGDLGMALHGDHGSAHMSHELVAFNVAVGAALLTVAWRMDRAGSQLPLLITFVALLAAVSTMDLLAGEVGWSRLSTHLPVAIGLVLAALAAYRGRDRTGPAGSAAAVADPPWTRAPVAAMPRRAATSTPPEPAARTGSAA